MKPSRPFQLSAPPTSMCLLGQSPFLVKAQLLTQISAFCRQWPSAVPITTPTIAYEHRRRATESWETRRAASLEGLTDITDYVAFTSCPVTNYDTWEIRLLILRLVVRNIC